MPPKGNIIIGLLLLSIYIIGGTYNDIPSYFLVGVVLIIGFINYENFFQRLIHKSNGAIEPDREKYKKIYLLSEALGNGSHVVPPRLLMYPNNSNPPSDFLSIGYTISQKDLTLSLLRIVFPNTADREEIRTSTIIFSERSISKFKFTEFRGIFAHEMAHLINRDSSKFMIVSTLPAMIITLTIKMLSLGNANPTFLGISTLLAQSLCLPYLQAAYFRFREYRADGAALEIAHRAAKLLGEKNFDIKKSGKELINAMKKTEKN